MTDIIIQPAADADDDLTNAVVLNDVTLPLANQSMAALGLSLGVSYKARVLGTAATFTVTQAPAFSVAASDSLSGRTLTVSPGTVTGNPTPTLSITMTLNGTPVTPSGSGPWTYEVPSAPSAQTVAWTVTATNAAGTAQSSGSEVVAADQSAPVISGVPTISGIEQVGETLTATAASHTGTPTPTVSWQWERSGTPISGATSSTYELVEADEGETITVIQTETNAIGSDSAESAATGAIAAAPIQPVLSSVSITDDGGGSGTMTLTFDAGEPDGQAVRIWGYIDTPADADPADGAAVAAGTGAVATFDVTSTVGAESVSVPLVGGPLDGTYDVFITASYDNGATYSDVVSDTGVAFDDVVPAISTLSPSDNATDVAVDANLVMTFNEAMSRVGTVTLKNAGGATIETFDLSTDGVWSSGDTVWTGNPASDFTGGAGLAVQWSGLEDASGNALADNSGDTTWNFDVVSASFTENAVTVASGVYLTASSAVTNPVGILAFGSFIMPTQTGRMALFCYDDYGEGFFIDTNSSAPTPEIGAFLTPVGESNMDPRLTYPAGVRVHVLISGRIESGVAYCDVAVWDQTSGTWSTASETQNPTTGTAFEFDTFNLRIFERADGTFGQQFIGTCYRAALWTFDTPGDVPDITTSAVQNLFTSGASLVDPATSQSAYASANITGTSILHVDLNGSATDYNNGTHDGTMTLTATGTFS